jgi:murein DD-endopeptidase MepM/ murein hydrolase activator NlpD
MLQKRYYILFVARDEDGRVRKIPLPLQYVYGFVAAALVGAFTIVGLAGSYTRMLLKTERFNQVRQDNQQLRKDYSQLAQVAHDRDVQVASLGALASEVTALYGLRQHKVIPAKGSAATAAAAPTPATLGTKDDVSAADVKMTFEQFNALRDQAMSGRVTRALEGGLSPDFPGDWTQFADAPSIWPVEGRVGSGFGQREDPINGEGAFHPGIDIEAAYGTPVRAAGDGIATGENMGAGYGRQVVLDHGHDLITLYGHLSAVSVVAGQHVVRGQIIGYVGQSGRATGPHLHYEVRVHKVPINPHKYLRMTYEQASLTPGASQHIASK